MENMEHSKDTTCLGLPHFCNAGLQAPKPAVKPEVQQAEKKETHPLPTQGNFSKQKPWSVFGDLYWI
jgi:hypothetical protein